MRLAFALLAMFTLAVPGRAQLRDNRDTQLNCNDSNRDRARVCEMREVTLGPSGMLEIEPGHNGGVTVKGWAQNSVLVRSRLEAWAENDTEAQAIASQVRLDIAGGRIRATGPDWTNSLFRWNEDRRWTVSFEVFAPFNTDLRTSSHNGGITLSDLRGRIDVRTHNGGIRLTRVAGDVFGETHNGGIQADLEGNTFEGRQLDLSTHNGGVTVSMPASYSARFETKSNRGRLDSDFPVTVRGRLDGGDLNFNIGSGGPLIRVSTHNGGVRLRRN